MKDDIILSGDDYSIGDEYFDENFFDNNSDSDVESSDILPQFDHVTDY